MNYELSIVHCPLFKMLQKQQIFTLKQKIIRFLFCWYCFIFFLHHQKHKNNLLFCCFLKFYIMKNLAKPRTVFLILVPLFICFSNLTAQITANSGGDKHFCTYPDSLNHLIIGGGPLHKEVFLHMSIDGQLIQ